MKTSRSIPAYKNDIGVAEIKIGVKSFVCVGETPPMDHPHIFLTMGDKDHTKCVCIVILNLYTMKHYQNTIHNHLNVFIITRMSINDSI